MQKIICSQAIQDYFSGLEKEIQKLYSRAQAARVKNLDPEQKVDIPLAANVAQRVEALISSIAPNVNGSKIAERLAELELQYGPGDWRVALKIAEEVAKQKIYTFDSDIDAIKTGIRTGLAYTTQGVVSAPLEGIVDVKIKKRQDGMPYIAIYFAGPIRGAGGTHQALSILIADYVRRKFGIGQYDPTPEEIKRYYTEVTDYFERVERKQYKPTELEMEFLITHVPVEINGDPTSEIEVSNYKRLPRVETDKIRGGLALVLTDGLPLKAKKLWRTLQRWASDFGLEEWKWLEEFNKLRDKIRASQSKQEEKESDVKVKPDFYYLSDMVAGRPVFAYPQRPGGFRLRYGRTRTTGHGSWAISPLTACVLKDYLAIGTQLKVEHPGKSTALTMCDYIDGSIVKLQDGSVVKVENEEQAAAVKNKIEEIIFLGDILISHGDFVEQAFPLMPSPYVEEWWALELKEALKGKDIPQNISKILENPIKTKLSFKEALEISKTYNVPLHPAWIFFWKDLPIENLKFLHTALKEKQIPNTPEIKSALEIIGAPHTIADEKIIFDDEIFESLQFQLNPGVEFPDVQKSLDAINQLSSIKIGDKAGTTIGARMGRPEKAKLRKMKGSPHILFPVGSAGGRLRSFQSALEAGKILSDWPVFICEQCNRTTIYPRCEICGSAAAPGKTKSKQSYEKRQLDIKEYFDSALKVLQLKEVSPLIKGVRGMSNRNHITEHLSKGILRAKYGLHVNKDGTIRYDITELPCTHFRPVEIGTSIEKLKEMGYTQDVHNLPLANSEQILELKPQDIILPSCPSSVEEGADKALLKVSKFVDDELENLYKLEPYYNLNSTSDLIGHLVIGLAPHTSAGILGRIIGFSATQALFAHPYWHSACRRDCLAYDTTVPIYNGETWNLVKIGEHVEALKPQEKADQFGTLSARAMGQYTLAFNCKTNAIEVAPILLFTKHTPSQILKIELEDGRTIKATASHKFHTKANNNLIEKRASELREGDSLITPYTLNIPERDVKEIDLERHFSSRSDVMVREIAPCVRRLIKKLGGRTKACKLLNLNRSLLNNYLSRNSIPLPLLLKLISSAKQSMNLPKKRYLGIARDDVKVPHLIPLNNDVLELIGLYAAEGCARARQTEKGLYQISIASCNKNLKTKIKKTVKKYFNLVPSCETPDAVIFSSRIFYEFFADILKAGQKARQKRIPNTILTLPKEKLASFLRGYFEGDGSVSLDELRVACDSVSDGLLADLQFALARFGIFTKKYTYKKAPGPAVRAFYEKKGREIPQFEITKLTIPSNFCYKYAAEIGFISDRKKKILTTILDKIHLRGMKIQSDEYFAYPKIKKIVPCGAEITYCLTVNPHHNFIANGLVVHNCDGEELAVMLVLDAFLNFSRQYLPDIRGGRSMDAPLVLTTILNPQEVDDEVYDVDTSWGYPLEFYQATLEYKPPATIKIEQVRDRIGRQEQYEGFGYTHEVSNINHGVCLSAYKTLPTMLEKLEGQLELARKIRAVDLANVAELVIERHFIRDIKGNLRKFTQQEFRCISCNAKYRRPPFSGICTACKGRLVFTIAEGTIKKYLEASLKLGQHCPPYLQQALSLLNLRIESIFGKEATKQIELKTWFG